MRQMNRRAFVSHVLSSTCGMAAGLEALGQDVRTADASLPQPCLPSSWKKHGIVLKASESWEGGRIQNFTSPAEPMDDGRWRIWYSGRGGKERFAIGYAEGELGGPMKKVPMQCSPGKAPDSPLAIGHLPDGSFEMYSVALVPVSKDDAAYIAHDNAAGFVRVIDHYRSKDGITFRDRRRAIQRDAEDPPDMQFYHLSVTRTSEGLVGMLGHYRVEAQTMDLEWCFSRDGRKWKRPLRKPWISRGDETQPDSYGIYPSASLLNHHRKWHLFYTGTNSAHNGKHSYGPYRTVVMHATTESIWA